MTVKATILLADDEEPMRQFLAGLLDRDGYRVITASDGEDALTKSEAYPGVIHLLVTDVMMPVMNGKELADRMCVLRPQIKVLFISGYSRTDIWPQEACEDQTDWLAKPFSPNAFHTRIRNILGAERKP